MFSNYRKLKKVRFIWWPFDLCYTFYNIVFLSKKLKGQLNAKHDLTVLHAKMLHEMTHVYDQIKAGFIKWRILYVLSKTFRKKAEFRAYTREIGYLQKTD